MKKILGNIRKADADFGMIEEGDKIAVGVSGGKDSMILLYALHLYQRFAPVKFEVVGITLKLGFKGMDFNPVIDFCRSHGIEYEMVDTRVFEILQAKSDSAGRLPCSLCSKFKKALLIKRAVELGCNKVSMAHHADDATETMVMNMIHNGYISTFKAKMYMTESDVTFIRPLIYCYERDIVKAARKFVPVVPSTCPMDKNTGREDVKMMLADLYKTYPTAKANLLNAMKNADRVSLLMQDEGKDEHDESC